MAKLQYKILEITPDSIQVLYYEEQENDGIFLNVASTPYPKTEAELIARIEQCAPHYYFEQRKTPVTDMSHLVGRSGAVGDTLNVPPAQAGQAAPPFTIPPGNTDRIISFEDN